MPNRNYINGRRKEYKIIKELKEKNFFIAQRSAGSHSPVDVFGIDLINKEILLIQCKPDNFPLSEMNKILEECKELEGYFKVKFEIR